MFGYNCLTFHTLGWEFSIDQNGIDRSMLVFVVLSNELVEPTEDFIVPLETVPMIQNPMVLIWENHQAARDPSPAS